jgi:hypothetical protein
VVVVAVIVAAAAVVWVSDVRFKDEPSALNCGTPIGAAWHRRSVSWMVTVGTNMQPSGNLVRLGPGLYAEPGTHGLFTVCASEARTRVAIAGGVVVLALAAVMLSRRRRGGSSPPLPAT